LSAEDGLAEREKIRQQLLDGGIAEEHADAIMRIVPYENGAHPKRADGGETHKYPNKRKGAVTTSKENDKNTRKKVEDQSELLVKLQHNENVSNNEIIELLKAQSKPPGRVTRRRRIRTRSTPRWPTPAEARAKVANREHKKTLRLH
jgi:hypothetical protein